MKKNFPGSRKWSGPEQNPLQATGNRRDREWNPFPTTGNGREREKIHYRQPGMDGNTGFPVFSRFSIPAESEM